ncbi:MAG: PKD domain-containing protein [Salinivirgaceae bacterium]
MRKALFCFFLSLLAGFSVLGQDTLLPNYPGLQLWLLADSVIKNPDNTVSQWTDLSGNSNHLLQPLSTAQPTQVNQALNNRAILRFDGTSDYLAGGDICDIAPEGATFFVVGKSNFKTGAFIAKSLAGGATKRYGVLYENNNLVYLFHSTAVANVSFAYPLGSYELITSQTDFINLKNKVRVNGLEKKSLTIPSSTDMNSSYTFLIGAYNNSSGTTPPYPGYYLNGDIAEILIYNRTLTETEITSVENYLKAKYNPILDLGQDREVYGFGPYELKSNASYQSYAWSTGETTPNIIINTDGRYHLTVTGNFGWVQQDTVNITFSKLQYPTLTKDTTLCLGDSLLWFSGLSTNYTHLWNNGQISSTITIKEAGRYFVTITDSLGYTLKSDTLTITIDSFPAQNSLGPDRALCKGETVTLSQQGDSIQSWLWNTGSTQSYISINSEGSYSVSVTNNRGCVASDSAFFSLSGEAPAVTFTADTVCLGDSTSFVNVSTVPLPDTIDSYLWNFGDGQTTALAEPRHLYTQADTFVVTLTATANSGCASFSIDSIIVNSVPETSFIIQNGANNCFGSTASYINTTTDTAYNSFLWSFGDNQISTEISPSHIYDTEGLYEVWLKATNQFACSDSTFTNIAVSSSFPLVSSTTKLFPTQDANVQDTAITFSWSSVQEAKAYRFILSDVSDFSTLIDSIDLMDTTYTVSFSDEGSYFWNVYTLNECGQYQEVVANAFDLSGPLFINNIGFWLKPNEPYLQTSGDTVISWTDASLNTLSWEQVEPSKRPLLKTDPTFPNIPVITFDGSNDFLTAGDTADIKPQGRTLFILGKSNLSSGAFYAKSKAADATNRHALFYENTLKSFYYTSADFTLSVGGNKPQWELIRLETDLIEGKNHIFINSKIKGSKDTPAEINMDNNYHFLLGAYNNTLGTNAGLYFLNGAIGEIIAYDKVLDSLESVQIEQYIYNKYSPPVNLGADIVINGFCDTTISAYKPWFTSYLWSNGSSDSAITVSQSGTYSLTVTDIFGNQSTDQIKVSYPIPVSLSDTTLCLGDSLLWDSGLDNYYSFEWLGSPVTTSFIYLSNAGKYAFKASGAGGCVFYSDTLTITIDSFPAQNSLGPDRALCKGETVTLSQQGDSIQSWLWNTGSTQSYISINSEGSYSVSVTNNRGCVASDSAFFSLSGEAPAVTFTADTVCLGDSTSFVNVSTVPLPDTIDSYLWNFGDGQTTALAEPRHLYTQADTFVVTLTATANSGCASFSIDSIIVNSVPETSFIIQNGANNCFGSTASYINTTTDTAYNSFLWSFGDNQISTEISPSHIYDTEGLYEVWLKATNQFACSDSTFTNIAVSSSFPLVSSTTKLFPTQDANVQDTAITFSWSSVQEAKAYRFILSDVSDFSTLIDSIDLMDTTYTVSFSDEGSYFWNVYTLNECGQYQEVVANAFDLSGPLFINNIGFWLKPNEPYLQTSGDTVISWTDASLNTLSWEQVEPSKRPLLKTDPTFPNIPVITFDGSNDFLTAGDTADIKPQGRTLFILGKSNLSSGAFYAKSKAADATNRHALFYENTLKSFYYTSADFTLSVGGNKPQWELIRLETDLIEGKNHIFINSKIKGSKDTPAEINMDNNYHFLLGAYNNTLGTNAGLYFLNGAIGEIIAYDKVLDSLESVQIEQYIYNKYSPPVNLGADIVINGFCDTTISAYKPWFTSYRWSINGDSISSDSAITVNKSGTYAVEVTDIFGFTSRDSITVSYPQPQQIASAELCRYDTLIWDLQLAGNYSFEWSNGQSTPVLNISEPGAYWLIIRDSLGNEWHSDTITINVDEFPKELSLGADTTLCLGNRLYLQNGSNEAQSYLWSDGSTLEYLQAETSGLYAVTATNARGCVGIDTINLTIQGIAPQPDFSVTQLCHKDSALFADLSLSPDGSDIINWVWDFGDGTQSNEKAPEHRYEDAGEYTVSLSIRNELLCSNSGQKTIQIHALPQAAFTPLTACSNTPVSFSENSFSTSGEVNQWQWTFPDGSVQTQASPEFTFATAGAHPVHLVVRSDLGCYDTLIQNIDIKPGPLSDFSFGPACQGLPVAFSDQSISFLNLPLEYSWDFGDGTGSQLSSPEKTYAETGSYQVSLRTTQTSNHCSSIVSKTLTVNPNPTARFELPVTCVNAPVVLTDLSESSSGAISEWVWKIDSLGTIRKQSPFVSFAYPGTYHINLSVTDNQACSDSVGGILTVHPLPVARFETSINKGPVPLMVSFNNQSKGAAGYLWDFGDGAGSEETHPQHTYVDSGSYTVQLSATSAEGCNASFFGSIRGIVPRVDLQVLDLKTELTSGYLKVWALLQNQGTLDLEQIVLQLHAQGSPPLREELKTTLYSGQTYLHEFATQLPLDANNPLTHICVNAFDLAYADEFLENNEICLALEDAFKMLPSYPNPAEDYLVVEYLIPTDARLSINLYDTNGKIKAVLYDRVSGAGFNRHRFDIADLGPGVYFYKISYKDKQYSRTFVVN